MHKTCDEMFRHFCRWIKTRRQCSGATRSNQNELSCIERRDQFGRDPIRRKLLVLDLSLTIRVWGRKLPCLSWRREEHTSRFVNRAQRLSPTTLNQVHTHSANLTRFIGTKRNEFRLNYDKNDDRGDYSPITHCSFSHLALWILSERNLIG